MLNYLVDLDHLHYLHYLHYLNTRPPDDNRNFLQAHNDPYKACQDAHAIAIMPEWDEFKALDWKHIYNHMKKTAFLFDGRLILDPDKMKEIGFEFYVIGKG